MATKGIVARGQGFDGGMNIRDAITQLSGNECRKLENGLLDERGGFSKRLGCLSKGTFGSSGHRVLSSYVFYKVGATPQLIIHTTNGDILYTNNPDAVTITWSTLVSGKSTTDPYSFETFNSKLYMSNGVDDYASWDGSTYTAFPSAPKGKYLRLWKDTMWVSGIAATPDRVWASDPGNAESFGVASWVDIAKGDGDQIIALASDGLFLIVGKRNRAMTIYDPVTFANRVVDFEKGFESHFSVAQFEGIIYYVSRRGICQWLGDTPSRIISGKIDPLFDPSILNLGALDRCWAYTHENRIGWAFPEIGSSINTFQLEYYPRLVDRNNSVGPFAIHRMPANQLVKWRSGSVERLFATSNIANKVYQAFADTGQDDGVTFSTIAETGALDFSRPTVTKYVRRMRVLGRGQFTLLMLKNFRIDINKTIPIDMSSGVDLWSSGETWGSDNWGPDFLLKEQKIHPDVYARFLTLRFTDSDTDTGTKAVPLGSKEYRLGAGEWAVYGYNLDATVLGVRD